MASKGSPQKRRRIESPKPASDEADDMDQSTDLAGTREEEEEEQQWCQRADWEDWSVEEVAQGLLDFGIPHDAVQKFKDNKIEGRSLNRITEDHVKNNLKIHELGTQLKIQEFLAVRLHSLQSKVFNDPVHGHMELHPLCVAIVDTPEFQRLRYLKQLGGCYFVYPGASHNRFEHSLGVCYLAGQLVSALQKRQPELGITRRDVLCVQIAGLCHDLGHGPFSHMFDKKFIPHTSPDWEHEKGSILMFDHLVKENQLESTFELYGMMAAERVFVKEQILGKPMSPSADGKKTWYYGAGSEKSFLYEIVANKRNGVDVDKWDYFRRDCLHLGIHSSFDHTRFIQFSRVIPVDNALQICVRDKEAFNMYGMFQTRHALHRRAYQHRVVQAVEIMLVDAMKIADKSILTPGKNGLFSISECINDMSAFTQLTDTVFQRILLSTETKLEKARAILRDIQRRKLYPCVGESQPITKTDIIGKTDNVIKDEILAELSEEEQVLLKVDESRFVVEMVKLDFGKSNKNPVDNLRFFSKGDKNRAVAVKASEVSFVVPHELYKEQLVRLFLRPTENKEADEKCLHLLQKGFQKWCLKNNLNKPKFPISSSTSTSTEAPDPQNEAEPAGPSSMSPKVSRKVNP